MKTSHWAMAISGLTFALLVIFIVGLKYSEAVRGFVGIGTTGT